MTGPTGVSVRGSTGVTGPTGGHIDLLTTTVNNAIILIPNNSSYVTLATLTPSSTISVFPQRVFVSYIQIPIVVPALSGSGFDLNVNFQVQIPELVSGVSYNFSASSTSYTTSLSFVLITADLGGQTQFTLEATATVNGGNCIVQSSNSNPLQFTVEISSL
jgi:hypothetical protein